MSLGRSSAAPQGAVPPRDAATDGEDAGASLPASARIAATMAGVTLGAALPMLMVVANKSAPAMFGAAAVLANVAACLGGQAPALRDRYKRLIGRPATLLVASAFILCLCSLGWSIDPAITRRGLVEALPELVSSLMLAAAWPMVARRRDIAWLIVGLFGAAALMAFEYRFGMPLHALVRERAEAWDLKRSAIPPMLMLWPAVAYAMARGQAWLALGLGAAVVLGIVVSHSGAPAFALVAALAVGMLARLAPRLAVGMVALLTVLLIGVGPWTGTLARTLPPAVETALAEEHASHRMRIWAAFEERAHDRWLLGHGFNASFKVSEAPRPGGRAPGADNDEMVRNHPHNIPLQLCVELGLVGALMAVAAATLVFTRLWSMRAQVLAPRLGLLIGIIGVGLVGLSAWQPWWLASIAASLLWFDFVAARFKA